MSTKTVTEKYENGKLIERTTVEKFDPPKSQYPYPYLFPLYEPYLSPSFKVSNLGVV